MKKIILIVCVLALAFFVYTKVAQSPEQVTPTNENITVHTPMSGGLVTSPLTITGEARGPWFFEASFPVMLTNWDGLIIAEGVATAQSDWMTEEFVPFTATLTFEKPKLYPERGTLILKKDNPSGLPEHDAAFEMPVRFE